ncbi:hypothetical protein PZA11_004936 [Diplocarpon coronariae]|uniref:Uncharacterized protein n=1 Tax=Diplocarpon coronariae TaxID=2795749 RepID=A0A218ZAU7_9HELO|nr:hypothetical protein JHW43_002836 [Diplocarpon mali]OWP04673.1 hypothetical protein B2J93_5692 [Marssonina coronariae]
MREKGRQKARAFRGTDSTSQASAAALEPPPPFRRAPARLTPFLSELAKPHVYITHVDTKPREFKRKIFLVPALMNAVIGGLIVWRIRAVGPYYLKICFSLMGRRNETTIDTAQMALRDSLLEILRRFAVFMVDLFIYVLFWPWPRAFFTGRIIGNPVAWRFAVGFRPQEIIVRRSRKWDRLIGNVLEQGPVQQELFDIIRRAVDPVWMAEKTGYLMLSREWDLDWKTMITATRLADTGTLSIQDFRTTILVHSEDFGWMVIERADAGGSAAEQQGREKIVAFKDELTALGKENLFFKWIELVQYESSRPGGFTPDKQVDTIAQAREMFEAQGVDFDKFWAKIGGMEGMPGMDQM